MTSHTRPNRAPVIAAVMASMAMIAIEATIVSTAMPQIAAQLGQLNLYSWVFSSFLLAQTAMTVVAGKLSDIYGRRPVILIGIAIFLVASVLAGFAWSMPSMIAFRLMQGIGAGCVQPVAMTLVGDLYPGAERAKIQGYLASVWALSAVLGPILGSAIVHSLPWAWVFWINVPVGILASLGFVLFLKEQKQARTVSIDFLGAGLFAIAISALMIALTDTSGAKGHMLIGLTVFAVSFVLFIWQERRAAAPMVSLPLWMRRPIASANAAVFLSGMVIMGLTTFLPMYVQTVLNRSPLVAGFALTMLLLGWPTAATISTRLFPRFGQRPVMITGGIFVPLGTLFLVFLVPESSPIQAGIGSLLMGLGMGCINVSGLVIMQESVGWAERGSATASNVFSRNLGSTLGAALLGAVLSHGLGNAGGTGPITSDQLRDLLQGSGVGLAADSPVRFALQDALHATFVAMFLISALIVIACLFVPATRRQAEAAPERS